MKTIERKFLVNNIPFSIEEYNGVKIEQGYLSLEPEIRVRKVGNKLMVNMKI